MPCRGIMNTVKEAVALPASKRAEAEKRIGMSLREYFVGAIRDGARLDDMAARLGVSRVTAWTWLRSCGYRPGYRRDRR